MLNLKLSLINQDFNIQSKTSDSAVYREQILGMLPTALPDLPLLNLNCAGAGPVLPGSLDGANLNLEVRRLRKLLPGRQISFARPVWKRDAVPSRTSHIVNYLLYFASHSAGPFVTSSLCSHSTGKTFSSRRCPVNAVC